MGGGDSGNKGKERRGGEGRGGEKKKGREKLCQHNEKLKLFHIRGTSILKGNIPSVNMYSIS